MDAAKRHPLYKSSVIHELRCPSELEYLWKWFCRLNGKRQVGMALNPLPSSEIIEWQRRYRIRFEPFEEAVIDQLDSIFMATHNKKVDT